MTLVCAPVPGRALPLEAVPDPVFAQAMVGPGAAIDPPAQVVDVVAPLAGTLVKVHPHAFVVRSDDGWAILVHLGIDTVQLGGAPFTVLVAEGSRVAAGGAIVRWDVPAVIASGRSAIVPVVVLEAPAEAVVPADGVTTQSPVTAGTPLLHLTPPPPPPPPPPPR